MLGAYFGDYSTDASLHLDLAEHSMPKINKWTRTLTLEPHTACRKGGLGLEYKIKRNKQYI